MGCHGCGWRGSSSTSLPLLARLPRLQQLPPLLLRWRRSLHARDPAGARDSSACTPAFALPAGAHAPALLCALLLLLLLLRRAVLLGLPLRALACAGGHRLEKPC